MIINQDRKQYGYCTSTSRSSTSEEAIAKFALQALTWLATRHCKKNIQKQLWTLFSANAYLDSSNNFEK